MSRLNMIDSQQAEGKQKELLDGVQKQLGMTPNLVRVFANSPAVLQGYLGLKDGLSEGALGTKLSEQIALAVAEENGCEYCVAAHTAVGKMLGLNRDEILDARQGTSSDSRAEAALQFANNVVKKRGWVDDEDLEKVRNAGYGDAEITEIVGHVVLNIFRNYFNHVAETPIDFPIAEPLAVPAK
jgi:uncharacterized peroxidase-related enzyme